MFRLFVFALALLPVAASAEGSMGMVRGRVFDAASGAPVCGLIVTATSNLDHRMLRRTDRDGFYIFLGVMPGISRILVDGAPAHGAAREAYVSANLITEVNLYVDADTAARAQCGAPIRGRA